MIIHCNSSGDLYTIPPASPTSSSRALLTCAAPAPVWHVHLGHPGHAVLNKLQQSCSITCNKIDERLGHACQLGKHVRLSFTNSM